MAETNAIATEPAKTPGVIAKAGLPERGEFPQQKQNADTAENLSGTSNAAAVGTSNAASTEQKNGTEKAEGQEGKIKLPELSEDQLKELFAQKGIEGFDGNFAALKEKLAKVDAPAAAEPSPEEKKLSESAFEKRMLDFHIATGGTPEQYVALKQVAAMDLKELSVAEIKKEMKENGFDNDEIDLVLKERYFQINPEELQQSVEETDEDFEKRKKLTQKKATYGNLKLDTRSKHTQEKAKGILDGLREAIKADDLEKQTEMQFSSKVDDYSKKVSRKVTLELGEVNETKLDPVSYDVSEADIDQVVAELKDPTKRKQLFFNEDKTLNLTKVMDVMLRNKYLESLAKAAFLEGGNRQVAAFKKVFPDSPFALGVGGAPQQNTGRKGVIAKAGKPEVAVPQQ